MSILTDWVTQIIVFIFIGTLLELVIPNHSMKRYVHIVVGLTLLLILVKPILFAFSVHIPSTIEKIENALDKQDMHLLSTENELNTQKKEIHTQQDAYIWNEITSQLIYEANTMLEEESILISVTDIQFEARDETDLTMETIEKMVVTLSNEQAGDQEVEVVEPIIIGQETNNNKTVKFPQENKVKKKLTQLWGIEEDKIEYIWEEGAT